MGLRMRFSMASTLGDGRLLRGSMRVRIGTAQVRVRAGEKPAVQKVMPQDLGKVLPWSGSGAQLRKELSSTEKSTARVAVSLVACALIYNSSIELASIAAIYWAWAPIWSGCFSNSLLRLRYRYAGVWSARVLRVQIIGPPKSNADGDFLADVFSKLPNMSFVLQLVIGDGKSPATFQMQVPIMEDVPTVEVGERVEVLVVSDKPSLSRFKALREVYLPDRGVWVSEEPCIERNYFEQLHKSRTLRSRQPDIEGGLVRETARFYLEENSSSRNNAKLWKPMKRDSSVPESGMRIADYEDIDFGYERKENKLEEIDDKDLYL